MYNYFFGTWSAAEQAFFSAQFPDNPVLLKQIQTAKATVRQDIRQQLEALNTELPGITPELALRLRNRIAKNCLTFAEKSTYLPDPNSLLQMGLRMGLHNNIANFAIGSLPFTISHWLKGLTMGLTNLISYYYSATIPYLTTVTVKVDVATHCKILKEFFVKNKSRLNPDYQTSELAALILLIMLEAEAQYLTYHPTFWRDFSAHFASRFLAPFSTFAAAHYYVDQKQAQSE